MFPADNDFESKFTFETEANPIDEDLPFHILLLGDWSGGHPGTELTNRRPLVVDRDNFDEVMTRLNVRLELDLEETGTGPQLSVRFNEIDSFHPDYLFRELPVFQELRELRRRLQNPDTFERAAGEVRSWFQSPSQADPVESDQPETDPAAEDSGSLLDAILSGTEQSSAQPVRKKSDQSDLSRLISQVVSPYLIKYDETEQAKLISGVDEATSEMMRRILHDPKFIELESAWRGLYFLVRKVETGVDLKIFILDAGKDEIINNLKLVNSLAESRLYHVMIEEAVETPGGDPWAAVFGNYAFHPDLDDTAALIRLSKLSQAADAPFISYMTPELFGYRDFVSAAGLDLMAPSEASTEAKLWSTLRTQPESNYLGLSPMRWLSRLPYGAATDRIETFDFEEFTDAPAAANLAWANPCFVAAYLLCLNHQNQGWSMAQGFALDINGLPLYIYRESGEAKTVPATEAALNESQIETLLSYGLMPLIAYRNDDRIRLARLQAVSDPLTALGGKWQD
jgi:type VI secretion system protein ImpC